jgi:hypothetical protein
MRVLLFASVLLFTATSCNRLFYYRPAPNQPEKTQVIYTHGVPNLRLHENAIDLAVDMTARGQRDINLGIALRNQSDSVFNFAPELIRVYGYDASGRKTPYRVFTAEQFIRRRNTRNAIIAGAAVVATVATVAAVADNSTGGGSDNNNNNNFDDDWFWIAATAPNMVVVNGGGFPGAFPGGPIDGLLRPHTLYPGEELRGVVKIQPRAGFSDKITVEIMVDGVYKQFVFDRRERRF